MGRRRSRSLTELTRQVTPPTKNGHAPPFILSRKALLACQSSVCPDQVSFPVLSQIKPQAPLLVCRSVNSFKFQPCDHTPPGTQRLWFPAEVPERPVSPRSGVFPLFKGGKRGQRGAHGGKIPFRSLAGIVYGQDYNGI